MLPEVADAEESKLKAEFERIALDLGLEVVDRAGSHGPSISWTEDSGRQIDVIRRRGRLADLIAVPKPDRDRNLGANTLKSALFHTARPVLMCPAGEQLPVSLGARVAIAWNGSLEATRAVAMNLDIFARAEDVAVLVANESGEPGTSAEDLLAYLGLPRCRSAPGAIPGQGECWPRPAGAEPLLGARTCWSWAPTDRATRRETVFGGNTQAVVDSARMPVVLVH